MIFESLKAATKKIHNNNNRHIALGSSPETGLNVKLVLFTKGPFK